MSFIFVRRGSPHECRVPRTTAPPSVRTPVQLSGVELSDVFFDAYPESAPPAFKAAIAFAEGVLTGGGVQISTQPLPRPSQRN
jgi:hypothetical protein